MFHSVANAVTRFAQLPEGLEPAQRQLAEMLGVAWITVVRAEMSFFEVPRMAAPGLQAIRLRFQRQAAKKERHAS
jgi:hypothetical protein